ncbi:hypothetical protein DFH09DRAFT_1320668 [Mycena vulgaris]|nr:hypothetical protein DFH09DRAFT_1320668 [Mycena vulgaris]
MAQSTSPLHSPLPAPPSPFRPRSLKNYDLKPNAHPYPRPRSWRRISGARCRLRRDKAMGESFPCPFGLFSHLPLPALHPTSFWPSPLHCHPIRNRPPSSTHVLVLTLLVRVSPTRAAVSHIPPHIHPFSLAPSTLPHPPPRLPFHLLTPPRFHISHRPLLALASPLFPSPLASTHFIPSSSTSASASPLARTQVARILPGVHRSIYSPPSLSPATPSSRSSPFAGLPILILFSPHLTHPHLLFHPLSPSTPPHHPRPPSPLDLALPFPDQPCGENASECFDENGMQIPAPLSLWIQTGAYALIAFSEILASITGLEYAFIKASKTMRSLAMSVSSSWPRSPPSLRPCLCVPPLSLHTLDLAPLHTHVLLSRSRTSCCYFQHSSIFS